MALTGEYLRLADKGPIRPPPRLTGPAGRVAVAVAAWPGVIAAAHWHLYRRTEIDGADFYVGEAELGHIHLDGSVHLATGGALRTRLISAGLARPFPWYDSWVETTIDGQIAADLALRLFRMNYERLRASAC